MSGIAAVINVGHIGETHYVSTIPLQSSLALLRNPEAKTTDDKSQNETPDLKKQKRNLYMREYRKKL